MACERKDKNRLGKDHKGEKESNFKSGVHLDGRFVLQNKAKQNAPSYAVCRKIAKTVKCPPDR